MTNSARSLDHASNQSRIILSVKRVNCRLTRASRLVINLILVLIL